MAASPLVCGGLSQCKKLHHQCGFAGSGVGSRNPEICPLFELHLHRLESLVCSRELLCLPVQGRTSSLGNWLATYLLA